MSSSIRRPARWYDDMDDILSQPEDDYMDWLAAKNDALRAARLQRLLDEDAARERDALHAEEMARYDGEETNPVEIDHQRLEEWYQGQEDIPY